MKYAFIQQHASEFPAAAQCRVLGVSRSGYYDWCKRPESARMKRDRELLQAIRRVQVVSRERYGIIKCWQQLLREGQPCGRDRVARLRRSHQIYSRQRRRFVVTTRTRCTDLLVPNHLDRQFNVTKPDRGWAGDVTFVPTREGWLFLAILVDLCSHTIVGWSMGARNDIELVVNCLTMALEQRKPASGLIHHSDRGSPYASNRYQGVLSASGIIPSMSRKGNCWDNAVAESFFSCLKNEMIYWDDYRSRDAARAAIFEYIEMFYNRRRLHQTLNYQTPEEFDREKRKEAA